MENNDSSTESKKQEEEKKVNDALNEKPSEHHYINQLNEKAKYTFKKRAIYALILLGTAIPCYILGGYFFLVFTLIFLVGAVFEITKVQFKKFPVVLFIINLFIVAALVFWPTLKFLFLDTKLSQALNINKVWTFINDGFYNEVWLSPIAIATALGIYFTISIFKEDFTIKHVFFFFTMSLLFGIGFQCILGVRYLPFRAFHLNDSIYPETYTQTAFFKYVQSMFFVVVAIGGIVLTDLGAYLFGIFFGKHKLNPRISPNKTVEGFIGGIFSSACITLTFMLVAAACGKPLLPIYDLNHWYLCLILSLGIPFASTLGDFAFSAIKRALGIKDFSNVLGPMGGMVDRIDSIMFGMMFILIYTTFVSNVAGNTFYY